MSKTFVRMFQPRFAPLVESGKKTQTIRAIPKRMPKVGDLLDARKWTGTPYRSPQQKLFVEPKPLTQVAEVIIWPHTAEVDGVKVDLDAFARADGFDDFSDMVGWFAEAHELPFEGVLFSWANVEE